MGASGNLRVINTRSMNEARVTSAENSIKRLTKTINMPAFVDDIPNQLQAID
jgi:hypothetical protein